MRAILIDDEPLAMERFAHLAQRIEDFEIVGKFDLVQEGLDFIEREAVDLAVLDIEMPGMNGIELGRELRKRRPEITLIYVTGYEQYALKAYNLHAVAYLMKPYTFEEMLYAVETARKLMHTAKKEVVIQTFGQFDVFVDGRPVFFASAKAKELLALMVDAKGSTIFSGYAISMLWEDKPFDEKSQSLYYKMAKSLEKTLKEYGIERIMIRTRHERCLNRKEVKCDYYDYLQGKESAIRAFHGEYMSQYSWAEETLATLQQYAENLE